MSKSMLRLEAIRLRRKGVSVKSIAQTLGISKSSASHWVRDIVLTVAQLENLRQASIKGAELGRLKSALIQREKRMKLIEESKSAGINRLSSLTKRELLIAGLALYWGGGGKKNRRVEFCNSDPGMIKFLILWLEKCFNVETSRLRCTVGINESHIKREKIVRKYWSEVLDIPLEQFRKTSFKRVKNSKIYDNFDNHFGTLSVVVSKSSSLFYEILGLIVGLNMAA